ncbi:MAG: MotA/TolQ/ExbB proton channel family protein [Candidatus Delongbacteria bacterium]|nr:MotA/TolQ/ExbB proton channel family protein [Candidatus Delongbacteria bacterium]
MSLISIVLKGGILVYLILALSIIGLAVFLERFFTIKKAAINSRAFLNRIKMLVLNNQLPEAIQVCSQTDAPVAHVLNGILKRRNLSYDEIKDSVETEANLQIYQLEKYFNVLGTIAAVSPLIGFLGTVTGMIRTFMAIEAHTGQVEPAILAGGIWEALITTAVGLTIGIPALIAYNYLVTKVEKFAFEIQQSSLDLLEVILNKEDPDEDHQ